MDDWQPIETAPKDGTQVLLCVAGFKPTVGSWETSEKYYGVIGWHDIHIEDFTVEDAWRLERASRIKHNIRYEPTHWMPLPNPPKEQK